MYLLSSFNTNSHESLTKSLNELQASLILRSLSYSLPRLQKKKSLCFSSPFGPYLCLSVPSWKHLTHPSDLYQSLFEYYATDGNSKAAVYNLVLSVKTRWQASESVQRVRHWRHLNLCPEITYDNIPGRICNYKCDNYYPWQDFA